MTRFCGINVPLWPSRLRRLLRPGNSLSPCYWRFLRAQMLIAICIGLRAQCTITGPNPVPNVPSEGLNVRVGDTKITCTFGDTPKGQPIPLINIFEVLNKPITTRVLQVPGSEGLVPIANNASEALLLIDEPGSNGNQPVPAVIDQYQQSSCFSGSPPVAGGSSPVPNVCFGLLTSPTVLTFYNVPALAGQHTYRIANVRADATNQRTHQDRITAFVQVRTASDNFPQSTPALVEGLKPSDTVVGQESSLDVAAIGTALAFLMQGTASVPTTGTGSSSTSGYAVFEMNGGNFPASSISQNNVAQDGASFGIVPPVSDTWEILEFDAVPGVAVSVPKVVQSKDSSHRLTLTTPNTLPSQMGSGFAVLPVSNNKSFATFLESGDPTGKPEYPIQIGANFSPGISPFTLKVRGYLAPSDGSYPQYYAVGSGPFTVIQGVDPAATSVSLSLTVNVGAYNCFVGQYLNFFLNACDVGGPAASFPFSVFSNQISGAGNITIVPPASDSHGLTGVATNFPGYSSGSNVSGTNLPVTGGINMQATADPSPPAAGAPPVPATSETVKLSVTVSGGLSVSTSYTVTVLSATTPVILPQGFTDVADYRGGFVAPGQIFSLFPQTYGQPDAYVPGTVDAKGTLANIVADTQVMFDAIPAPLLGVTPTQIIGIAPFELTGKTSTAVSLVYKGVSSPPMVLRVIPASISVISANGFGGGPCACLNQDQSFNTQSNPAYPGDIIVLIVNYGGPMDVAGTDGRTTVAPPYNKPQGPISAIIGGVPVTNFPYVGNLPGFAESAEQWNLTIPLGVKPGLNMIQISAGGATNARFASIWIGQK